jgi:hypothetical protein
LVEVKPDTRPEKPRCVFPDRAVRGELGERGAGFVSRIEGEHRVGPQLAALKHVGDEALNPLIADVNKAFDVLAIMVDYMPAQPEYVE